MMRQPIQARRRTFRAQSTRNWQSRHGGQAGMTLLELIIACAILLVLATAAMPVARFTVMRQKESELRHDLREMRDAIDSYKDAADRNRIPRCCRLSTILRIYELVDGVKSWRSQTGKTPNRTTQAAV